MKSRISFFDKTLFRKNLTRFAPAWGIYIICMIMGLLIMLDGSSAWWLPQNMADCIQIMSVISPCYALLTAQLLFGDLFNSRMCNAIHALPLRRETLFMTNIASGLIFHLIPTGIMALISTVIMALGSFDGGWVMGFWWLVGVNLQYLCFFGIAVLSAFLVGSRFAMVVVYGIINFAAIIFLWLIDSLYMPLFFGVQLDTEPFIQFCPVVKMVSDPFIQVIRIYDEVYSAAHDADILRGDCFGYYFLCAAAGLGFMAGALALYRRRHLESAGDFISFRKAEPVFHVIYSLIVGAVFAFIVDDIFGYGDGFIFLFVGLALGYFTGRMLLLRSPRVFQKRGWLGCGILLCAFGISLFLSAVDPLGIVSWTPKADQVRSVTIYDSHYYGRSVQLEDPADIEAVISMHKFALDEHLDSNAAIPQEEVTYEYPLAEESKGTSFYTIPITIEYHLKTSRTVTRQYHIWNHTEQGSHLYHWFSAPEAIFGEIHDLSSLTASCTQILVQDTWEGLETTLTDGEQIRGLIQAILADCEAGNMAQSCQFHQGTNNYYWIYLYQGKLNQEVTIFASCEHTLNWLRDNGFNVDEIIAEYDRHY